MHVWVISQTTIIRLYLNHPCERVKRILAISRHFPVEITLPIAVVLTDMHQFISYMSTPNVTD